MDFQGKGSVQLPQTLQTFRSKVSTGFRKWKSLVTVIRVASGSKMETRLPVIKKEQEMVAMGRRQGGTGREYKIEGSCIVTMADKVDVEWGAEADIG